MAWVDSKKPFNGNLLLRERKNVTVACNAKQYESYEIIHVSCSGSFTGHWHLNAHFLQDERENKKKEKI